MKSLDPNHLLTLGAEGFLGGMTPGDYLSLQQHGDVVPGIAASALLTRVTACLHLVSQLLKHGPPMLLINFLCNAELLADNPYDCLNQVRPSILLPV